MGLQGMSQLGKIAAFVQQVADVIAAVLEFGITIIDDELKIVAAGGKALRTFGSGHGTLTEQLLKSGRYYLSDNPDTFPACQGCENLSQCKYLAVLTYPIKVEDRVVGSISLTAMDEQQRTALLANKARLLDFIDKIAVLLAALIREQQANEEREKMARQFQVVINSVEEGIIATDAVGQITHLNTAASRLLGIAPQEAAGRTAAELFPDIDWQELFKKPVSLQKEIFGNKSMRKLHLWTTINPIRKGEHVEGLAMSLRNMSDVRQMAAKFIGYQKTFTFDEIITLSPSMINLKERARKAAATDSTILIRGESGTGKELFARAIHAGSFRRNGPFIAINCGAIPESLLESELFGYDEGAFTGAKRGGKPGKFELANSGTLFLDEIGDMPLHLQVKILRVLEEKCIERVGGTATIRTDVRIVAATHRNLEAMLSLREFREDLYYRLSVIPLTIPPLRERVEDIPLLMNYFIQVYNQKLGKRIAGLTQEASHIINSYQWHGNVRELENIVEYAMSMETGEWISRESLPVKILESIKSEQEEKAEFAKLKCLEKEALLAALEKFGYSVRGKERAAQYLGISRATLYRKLKEIQASEPAS